jgi:hypothetical protein
MNRRQALQTIAGTALGATGLPLVAGEVSGPAVLVDIEQVKTPVINPELWGAVKKIEGWYDLQTGLTDILTGLQPN